MFNSLDKMKQSLADMEELHADVKAGNFIPKRFRKMDVKKFMEVERFKYVAYLEREIKDLKYRIRQNERHR
jgi:hypothetical protein